MIPVIVLIFMWHNVLFYVQSGKKLKLTNTHWKRMNINLKTKLCWAWNEYHIVNMETELLVNPWSYCPVCLQLQLYGFHIVNHSVSTYLIRVIHCIFTRYLKTSNLKTIFTVFIWIRVKRNITLISAISLLEQ